MKFQAQVNVIGMKASKGDYEGVAFDSTKVYVLVDLDGSKGQAKGQAVTEYPMGPASNFDKFKHLLFPFKADADMEVISTGKVSKTVMNDIRPVVGQSVHAKQ